MTTIDRRFVDGVFWRMLVLGALTAAFAAVVVSLHFGWSLAVGALVGATSLRITAAIVERMIRRVVEGSGQNAGWGIALALKMLALLVVVFVVLVFLRADAIAFVIGFKMILPALAWQLIRNPGQVLHSDDDANDIEST